MEQVHQQKVSESLKCISAALVFWAMPPVLYKSSNRVKGTQLVHHIWCVTRISLVRRAESVTSVERQQLSSICWLNPVTFCCCHGLARQWTLHGRRWRVLPSAKTTCIAEHFINPHQFKTTTSEHDTKIHKSFKFRFPDVLNSRQIFGSQILDLEFVKRSIQLEFTTTVNVISDRWHLKNTTYEEILAETHQRNFCLFNGASFLKTRGQAAIEIVGKRPQPKAMKPPLFPIEKSIDDHPTNATERKKIPGGDETLHSCPNADKTQIRRQRQITFWKTRGKKSDKSRKSVTSIQGAICFCVCATEHARRFCTIDRSSETPTALHN